VNGSERCLEPAGRFSRNNNVVNQNVSEGRCDGGAETEEEAVMYALRHVHSIARITMSTIPGAEEIFKHTWRRSTGTNSIGTASVRGLYMPHVMTRLHNVIGRDERSILCFETRDRVKDDKLLPMLPVALDGSLVPRWRVLC
jgi:hypothetical protein